MQIKRSPSAHSILRLDYVPKTREAMFEGVNEIGPFESGGKSKDSPRFH